MPALGIGTYKTPDGSVVEEAVSTALERGYRQVDTASLYGNETGVGVAIAASGVPRQEVFVTTKVWNEEQGYDETLLALGRSLDRLGMDYVDLYLVHWPLPEHMAGTWKAMEELLRSGKTRAIGVCNHLEHHLETLFEIADVPPAVNQIEHHFGLQQPALTAYCARRGIVVQAWAPLMRGRVAEMPQVTEIASAHGVTPYQVAIRWVLQEGFSAIPKSVHAERITANADVFHFELSADEMAVLVSLDAGERISRHPDTWADPATRPQIEMP
jgi:diketogulonate reductase-like aldo/keto reductase